MAEVSGFASLIGFLTGADAFSLLFPFLLAWMLYYAAIDKIDLFDDTNLNNAPPVIALFLAFFTARFLVMQPFYQNFFSIFFGKVVVALVTLLGLYSLLAFTGHDLGDNDLVKGFAVLSVGAAFLWAGGFGPWMTERGEVSGGIVAAISGLIGTLFETGAIWLLVIGGTMWAVMSTGNDNGAGDPNPDDETDE